MIKRLVCGKLYKEKRKDDLKYFAYIIRFEYSKSGKTRYIIYSINGNQHQMTESQFRKNYKEDL